ncbi:MAG: hypothetical protein ACKV2Q_02360 [Planctomycetaceae bacterium]
MYVVQEHHWGITILAFQFQPFLIGNRSFVQVPQAERIAFFFNQIDRLPFRTAIVIRRTGSVKQFGIEPYQ